MKKLFIIVCLVIESCILSSDMDKKWVKDFKILDQLLENQKIARANLFGEKRLPVGIYNDPCHLYHAALVRQQVIYQKSYALLVLTEQINKNLPNYVQAPHDNSVFSGQTTDESCVSSVSDISLASNFNDIAHEIHDQSHNQPDDQDEASILSIETTFADQIAKKLKKDRIKFAQLHAQEYAKKRELQEQQKRAQQSLFDKGRYALQQEKLQADLFTQNLEKKIKKDHQKYLSFQSLIEQEKKEKAEKSFLAAQKIAEQQLFQLSQIDNLQNSLHQVQMATSDVLPEQQKKSIKIIQKSIKKLLKTGNLGQENLLPLLIENLKKYGIHHDKLENMVQSAMINFTIKVSREGFELCKEHCPIFDGAKFFEKIVTPTLDEDFLLLLSNFNQKHDLHMSCDQMHYIREINKQLFISMLAVRYQNSLLVS